MPVIGTTRNDNLIAFLRNHTPYDQEYYAVSVIDRISFWNETEWGWWAVISQESVPNCTVKYLIFKPGCSTSKQMHTKRSELLDVSNGLHVQLFDMPMLTDPTGWRYVPSYTYHKYTNPLLVHVAGWELLMGEYDESDVIRCIDGVTAFGFPPKNI